MENSGKKQKKSGQSGSAGFAIIFLIQFLVTMAILFTDHNLQTDFGSVSKYFLHWYGLLVTGAVDIVAFIVLLVSRRRSLVAVGVGWSVFMVIFQVADIFTYNMLNVGLTATQFAQYLFGVTKYPGSLSYIPGLYDVLLIIYVVAIAVGLYTHRRMK